MNNADAVDYELLGKQAEAMIAGETDALANAANFVALLNENIDRINWIGIYVLRGDELVLGPFQGKPACVRIQLGKGVCGTAALERRTLRIADVHSFDGHIACDAASNSELVVPLIRREQVIGVLDIDSPLFDRFSEADQRGVEALCNTFIRTLDITGQTFI